MSSRPVREGWRTAFAPATVANFGSGFDAFAAALAEVVPASRGGGIAPRGDRVSVRRSSRKGVRVVAITGDGGRLPRDASKNCAAVAAAAVLRRARAPFGLDLVLDKGLPLSSGLGSSAASAAAGAFAASLAVGDGVDPLGGRQAAMRTTSSNGTFGPGEDLPATETHSRNKAPSSKAELLAPALAGEHVADGSWHGDNVFASLLGGGVIVLSTKGCEVVRLDGPPSLRWVVVHPDFELQTRRARAVLPKRVPLADASAQAASFASLVEAWGRGDRAGIGRGLQDRLAEPRRARLVPGYEPVRRAALKAGAYGLTFSGAGPSILAVTPEGEEERIGEAMRAAFKKARLESSLLVCAVDAIGAREVEP